MGEIWWYTITRFPMVQFIIEFFIYFCFLTEEAVFVKKSFRDISGTQNPSRNLSFLLILHSAK